MVVYGRVETTAALSRGAYRSEGKDGVVDLCSRFIELQAFGGVVAEGEEIRMKSLPPGLRCRHRGDLDDPDFVHLEIGPDFQ